MKRLDSRYAKLRKELRDKAREIRDFQEGHAHCFGPWRIKEDWWIRECAGCEDLEVEPYK